MVTIGIDASRNRSGGARAHIIGILHSMDESLLKNEIREVHIWSYPELLEKLPDRPWLMKHSPKALQKGIAHQLWWQYRQLPLALKATQTDILLNTDAGTVCNFTPSVTMSRDMLSYEAGEMQRYGWGRQRLRLEVLKYIQNRSLRQASAAIFLTRYAAKVIQQSSGKICYYKVIHHGVSDIFRVPTSGGVWEEKEGKTIKCVYVSNLDLYKHQWQVARALDNLRKKGYEVTMDFVGGGDGEARALLNRTLSEMDHRDFIAQHAFVAHAELPAIIQNKDIIVFASSCENMPNTLIEGMATGLPIACSNRGPMPEVLQDGGVYFDPENAGEIEEAIRTIIESPEKRQYIAKRALQLSQHFTWERCSRETFGFLTETMHRINNSDKLKQ